MQNFERYRKNSICIRVTNLNFTGVFTKKKIETIKLEYYSLREKVEANHLACIEPWWYRSQISADCQQNLLSPRRDTSEKFLLVIFLKEQKREDDTQRRQR